MKKNTDKKQSGEIIIFVVFVILFMMLFVTLFISRTLLKQAKASDNIVSSVQAFYIADSGAEYSLYMYKNFCTTPGSLPGCIGSFSFTNGTCQIVVDPVTSKMDITGTYKGQTSRAIELIWN